MLEPVEKEASDPAVAGMLDDVRREFAASDVEFIAVVTVRPGGGSTRRLYYGGAKLATVAGAIEAAKAVVLTHCLPFNFIFVSGLSGGGGVACTWFG